MHSENTINQKIIRLLKSEDPEQKRLGELTLIKKANKANMPYWYIKLEPLINNLSSETIQYLESICPWSTSQPVINRMAELVTHISLNPCEAYVIETFFTYYNNYVFGMMTDTWDHEKRQEVLKQITALHELRPPKEFNKDL